MIATNLRDITTDPAVRAHLRIGVERRQANGSLKPTRCRICNRQLSDPDSILAGIGPECSAIERVEAEQGQRFPAGCQVRVTSGAYEGCEGVVGHYQPRRNHKANQRPFLVHFGGWRASFSADQLERIEVAA